MSFISGNFYTDVYIASFIKPFFTAINMTEHKNVKGLVYVPDIMLFILDYVICLTADNPLSFNQTSAVTSL